MTEPRHSLRDALRAHLDLGEAPDEALAAWAAASDEERNEALDQRLTEALLLDTLGRARAGLTSAPRRRERFATRTLLLAAAALLVALGAGLLLYRSSSGYPQATVAGDFTLQSVTGEAVSRCVVYRGERITAGPDAARLALGGYCDVALTPGAAVVLRGEPRKEVVELEEGKVVSRVVPEKGGFVLLTPLGHLEVVGTEFETTVAFPEPKGAEDMGRAKRSVIVTVAVISGLVAYHFGELSGTLGGGASKVFAGEATEGGKKIVAGKPTYKAKGDHPAWREKGRIVGLLRQCPGCELDVLDGEGKEVLSTAPKAGDKTYELQWLKPGTYTLRVSAKGYEPLVVKELVVKAKNDLVMHIEFED